MAKGGSHRPALGTPYMINSEGEIASKDYLFPGGDIIYGIANQQMLLGDAVFKTSVVNVFDKSVTVANYATLVGVVVGGRATDFKVLQIDTINQAASGPASVVGQLPVAQANQEILIMIWGVAYAIADAALATIGTKLTGAATTAGRVGSVGAASGNYIGIQLDTAAGAGNIIRVGVGYAG